MRLITLAVVAGGLAMASVALAQQTAPAHPLPKGPNTINGKVVAASAVAKPCGASVVYMYAAFPLIGAADGATRTPEFELPDAETEHWETRCTGSSFTFKDIPDGSYLVGVPGADKTGPAYTNLVAVSEGKAVTVELKLEDSDH